MTLILSNKFNTLPAEFIEKAICMSIKVELYHWEYVILRSCVVLKGNLQSDS